MDVPLFPKADAAETAVLHTEFMALAPIVPCMPRTEVFLYWTDMSSRLELGWIILLTPGSLILSPSLGHSPCELDG